MKKSLYVAFLSLSACFILNIAGCGGGGGSPAPTPKATETPKATVKLYLIGYYLPTSTNRISTISATIVLPPGVTPTPTLTTNLMTESLPAVPATSAQVSASVTSPGTVEFTLINNSPYLNITSPAEPGKLEIATISFPLSATRIVDFSFAGIPTVYEALFDSGGVITSNTNVADPPLTLTVETSYN
ncbi:MAG: hypothetical protein ACYDG4_01980 [Desulfuromonadaceae bacterium]